MQKQTFTNNGKRFRYEFRQECALVIFVDFPLNIFQLADAIETGTDVQRVIRASRYDDGGGDLVVKLFTGYQQDRTENMLQHIFTSFTV